MMKNKYLNIIFLLSALLFVATSCDDTEEVKSTPKATSIPFIAESFIEPAYVYGFGQTNIYNDIPDVVAIAVDSVVGFVGGYGGKTGMDSIKVLKSDIISWPDTVAVGGYSLTFQKFNKAEYKATLGTNIVIAGSIPNPGPTDLAGTYKRTSNGFLIEIKKVFPGVYVIDNPGGAGVLPFPYLLYNYDDGSGGDKLVFPIQPDPCPPSGLQLVGPTAPNGLSSADYSTNFPPIIAARTPLTLQWRVYEFPQANPNSTHTGEALCQWGLGIRTFEKQ
jgi:hypothetical protein